MIRDTSDLFVARTGIRGANDLVWVGRAANYAAKLSDRSGADTQITEEVYNQMHKSVKFDPNGYDIWNRGRASEINNKTIYTTSGWYAV